MTLKLNGSSSGSVSIDAPASTTAGADITFNFPVADGSANQVLQTNGSGQLQWVTLPTGGLSEYDMWRLTSDISNTLNPLVNWERCDTEGFAKVGTGMSHSGGTFTFPSTGIWEVIARPHYRQTSGGDSDHMYMQVQYTSDNGSNWATAVNAVMANLDNNNQGTPTAFFCTDVTDTSNQKIKFGFDPDHSNGQIRGSSSDNKTLVIFKKIAET